MAEHDPERGSRPFLRDAGPEHELHRDGYTVVPLLGPDEVADLAATYAEIAGVPTDRDQIVVDYTRRDRELVGRLDAALRAAWCEFLPRILHDHQVALTTFVAKPPGHGSAMYLHDDRSYADPRRHRSVTVWVPLADTGPTIPNGGLEVIPGSHRLNRHGSGTDTPHLFRRYESYLSSHLVPVTAAAGEAVVYDSRLLHASAPNLSGSTRLAAVAALAPAGVDLVHVVALDRRRRRVYSIDTSFFVDLHPHDVARSVEGRYPVLDEYVDSATLAASDVGEALSAAVAPVPQPLLPADLCSTLAPGVLRGDGIVVCEPERVDVAVPPATAPGRRAGGANILVEVAPGERVGLASIVAGPATVFVLDCPAIGAGLGSRDGSVSFDIATSVRLPDTEGVIVWNDGPGNLEMAVATDPEQPTGRIPGALRRIAGSFGNLRR